MIRKKLVLAAAAIALATFASACQDNAAAQPHWLTPGDTTVVVKRPEAKYVGVTPNLTQLRAMLRAAADKDEGAYYLAFSRAEWWKLSDGTGVLLLDYDPLRGIAKVQVIDGKRRGHIGYVLCTSLRARPFGCQ